MPNKSQRWVICRGKEIEDLDIQKTSLKFEIHTTEYFDGEHDDTYSTDITIERDINSEFDHIPTIEHDDTVIHKLGLDNRSDLETVDGEQTWVSKIMFNRYHSAMEKMWFTDSVIIPHPFNMLLPTWLIKAIRKGLTKRKV